MKDGIRINDAGTFVGGISQHIIRE